MRNHLEPVSGENGSPFDAIKNTDPVNGREFWSARDLMPMLGYDKWQNFTAALDRAKLAAEVQGHNVENHFTGASKLLTRGNRGGTQAGADFHLSRFACYLAAMNGDPRKPEIAAAMSYFAIRTREAETRPQIDGASLTRLELIQIAMNAETERLELEAKNRELEPKAEAFDAFLETDAAYAVGAVAKMLGLSQNKLFQRLRAEKILIAQGHMRNTPYQQYTRYFAVDAHTYERRDGTTGGSYTTKVLAEGIDFIRRKLDLPRIDPVIPGVDEGASMQLHLLE